MAIKNIAENLWLKHYPLSVLGTSHGRNVTVIRLASGKTVLHSMAPFSAEDLKEIQSLGSPAWLVESMLLHDTYAKEGRAAFPELPFYGPPSFSDVVGFPTLSLESPPAEWAEEIRVIPLEGVPQLREYAMVHLPSRTLIVADLVFNFPADETGWNHFFHRYLAGMKRYPAMSRIFRLLIRDRAAFRQSIDRLMALDFDRIIVGHGNLVESQGKELLKRALRDAGI